MKLTRTQKNMRIINDIVKHPDVYDLIWDDHSKDLFDTNLGSTFLSLQSFSVLNPREGCLFVLTLNSLTLSELHTMIAPGARGMNAIEAAKEAADWYFTNTSCEKIITHIPDFNRPACILARKFGMRKEGNNTKSFKRDGILHDQFVYGLEKEAFQCQQSQR